MDRHTAETEAGDYDLKAGNPNAKKDQDERTPEELLALIETRSCLTYEVGPHRGGGIACPRCLDAKDP